MIPEPTRTQIDDAIAYALHHARITEVQRDESVYFEVEIYEPESVKDFVLAVLRYLEVTS